jgi:uncharacterized protein with PIN domain
MLVIDTSALMAIVLPESEAAIRLDCPLLYVGGDFAKTDVISALS